MPYTDGIARTVDRRTRQRIFEAAVSLLDRRGFSSELLKGAAEEAGYPLDRARIYFRRDEDLVLALYARLAADFEARIIELPEGDIADRFHAAMTAKLDIIAPYQETFASLINIVLNPRHRLGVLNEQTEVIRNRVMSVFSAAVLGAKNQTRSTEALVYLLYWIHLLIILIWTQDPTPDHLIARTASQFVRNLLYLSGPFFSIEAAQTVLSKVTRSLMPFLDPVVDSSKTELSITILKKIFRRRRLQQHAGSCAENPCKQCIAIHLPKVRRFVAASEPVHLLLPAFPAKSPNQKKVLGILPDMGEELALGLLHDLCSEIREIYPPGAYITICSDGRVFSDLVDVTDDNVTNYGLEIRAMIERLGADTLDTFCLEDLFEASDHDSMRAHLCSQYAESIKTIEDRTHNFPQHQTLFNGIHRFLFEDRVVLEPEKSRTRVRKECKDLAYNVIQRSDAWGRLIADCFPTSLRLSIHPQDPHSEKIGILLGEADDTWLTPWHGVAVSQNQKFKLMPRHEAEGLGATLVERDGRPSHFQI